MTSKLHHFTIVMCREKQWGSRKRCQWSWANAFTSKNEKSWLISNVEGWYVLLRTKSAFHRTLCTNSSRAFLLRWPDEPCIPLSTRINNYITTGCSKSLLFVGMKFDAGLSFHWSSEPQVQLRPCDNCAETAALLSIFDVQESHLKVWSYSQYPACNCSLLYQRENSQYQIQIFAILEQKAKDIGFSLLKEGKWNLFTLFFSTFLKICARLALHLIFHDFESKQSPIFFLLSNEYFQQWSISSFFT